MNRYFNDDAYLLTQNDTWPSYTFQIGTNGVASDFSVYPSRVVTAYVRQKGADTTLAEITCSAVNAATGQFKITTWPSTVTSVNPTNLEVQVEVDYYGDGVQVSTAINLIKFRLLEKFASA